MSFNKCHLSDCQVKKKKYISFGKIGILSTKEVQLEFYTCSGNTNGFHHGLGREMLGRLYVHKLPLLKAVSQHCK